MIRKEGVATLTATPVLSTHSVTIVQALRDLRLMTPVSYMAV